MTKQAGKAVKNLRERHKISQRQLSSMTYIPQSAISRIEAGSNTTIQTLNRLGEALGESVSVSFGDNEDDDDDG